MSKWLVSVAVMAVLTTGCSFGNSAQTCSSDQQCQSGTSPGGRCEPGFGLCSFTDTVCPSGRRFGGLSGDKSGACVGGSPPIADAAIDVPPIDAAIDAPPDAQACFGTAPFTICLRNSPGPAILFSGITSINTTTSDLCVATVSGGDGYCVIAATSITINAGISVQAFGAKPLVLLASDSITTGISSTIDVGSHRATLTADEIVGAGADPASCDAGMAPTTVNNTSGGGAGGSFIGPGGKGGQGSSNNNSAGVAGAIATAPVTTLRGGCPGQAGAGATNAAAGHGGGAVMLIAGNSITINNGNVDASGEGGSGGQFGFAGGGGGGAGGMIVFDAPFITATTTTSEIFANGGGGGEGGNQNQTGAPGFDPSDETAATGGGAIGNGGNGGTGAGGTASATAGANGAGAGGGGGGGGGTGLFKAPATAVLGSRVSPPPTR